MEYKFSGESLLFLDENCLNNSRTWYQENKPRYQEHLVKPFGRLVTELAATMLKIDDQMQTAPGVGKTLSRIYRDTRFSKDKSLYRNSMWITFKAFMKDVHNYPAFYFEITPHGYSYGMGFFAPNASVMESYRRAILNDEEKFLKIIKKLEKTSDFKVAGECYVRPKYKGTNEKIHEWFDRKDIYVRIGSDHVMDVFDFDWLRDTLAADFEKLTDLYRFFRDSQLYFIE